MVSNIDTKHSRSSIILYISILLKKNNYLWSPAASWRRNPMINHQTTTSSVVEILCITDIRDVTSTKTRGPMVTPSSLHGGKMPPPSRASSSTRFLRASHADLACRPQKTLLNKHETDWVFEGFLFHSWCIYIYTHKMPRKAPVKVAKIMTFHNVWL